MPKLKLIKSGEDEDADGNGTGDSEAKANDLDIETAGDEIPEDELGEHEDSEMSLANRESSES